MQEDEMLAVLGRLEAGLAKLEAGQTKLEAGQTKLEAGQAKLEAGQAKLEAGQAKLEAGQAKLEAGHTSLRVDLMARMDRLEDKVNSVREDINVNMGAATMARRVNDNTREELRQLNTTVDALYRKVHRLETVVDEKKP